MIHRIPWNRESPQKVDDILQREWLLTNGLGGYASGTISGHASRRYHGLLIAALPSPFGRTVMLNHLADWVCCPNGALEQLGGHEDTESEGYREKPEHLTEFRLENQLPVWRYKVQGLTIERRLVLPYRQNTVHVTYRLIGGHGPVRLQLRPSVHFRPHEGAVNQGPTTGYTLSIQGDQYEIAQSDFPHPLRFQMRGHSSSLIYEGGTERDVFYRIESERGYEDRGRIWSPGYFEVTLSPDRDATFIASTEDWSTIHALTPVQAVASEHDRRQRLIARAHPCAQEGVAAELVLAADQFIITPAGRTEDAARARAEGDEVRTVIAGYHWFTDWGRDTMISLEGLTLTTGRHNEAGWILRTFAHYVRDGLIPNMFPEGKNQGLYHTADATLWFFHALDRYLTHTRDQATLLQLLPTLREIVRKHLEGTLFSIGVDPADDLLRQGEEGYQLTWMDAKVDDWVVTPRRGKAVEINALWYNALCLLRDWLQAHDPAEAQRLDEIATRTRSSFNRRFWNDKTGYLFDVIDGEQGDDPVCRPNQILSFSLRHPVLEEARWVPVLNVVRERLLTPVGLRSLSAQDPDYKAKYFGNLRARDAAYHQGTVWGWLIGPYIDAWLRAHPNDLQHARSALEGFIPHLDEACVGSISEIFDAESPFTPRGCVAQAWSVAEVLRCWVKTEEK